jgi:hypothetical protein
LPAAAVLVRSGQKTPQQIHGQLRPLFDAAPLERRASYALWLSGAGMPKEALTLITAQEAGESTAAFGARTEALFATQNLDGVLAAVEAGGNVDADVRLAPPKPAPNTPADAVRRAAQPPCARQWTPRQSRGASS